MIFKFKSAEQKVIGDIEYSFISKEKTFYIDEITIYKEEHRRKHLASKMLYSLANEYFQSQDVKAYTFVGISTNSAIPFWKKIGALVAQEKDNGDAFFILKGVSLFIYLRNILEKEKEVKIK